MTRSQASLPHAVLVWASATAGLLGLLRLVATDAVGGAGPTVAGLVLQVASAALVGCGCWAWLVVTVVVVEAVRGRTTGVRGVPAWARRAVLLACGVAALAAPATAAVPGAGGPEPGSRAPGAPHLAGLPFPDRPLGAGHEDAAPPAGADRPDRPDGADRADRAVHVVAPGESLWSIADDAVRPTDPAAVAAAARRLYRVNRAVVGADPDLIQPGQQLRVPLGEHPDR